MTVSELYDHVSRLGFEDSLEDEKKFYNATNRALLQVGAIRPATGVLEINHSPLRNLLGDTSAPILRSETLCFDAVGARAFFFEAEGEGYCKILDADGSELTVEEFNSKGKFSSYRGFVKRGADWYEGAVQMRFEGEYAYSVRNVALYAEVYSSNPDDVPSYSPYVRYDMRDLVDDFLTFSVPPVQSTDGYRRMREGYNMEGISTVMFPSNVPGSYRLLYNRRPKKLEYKVTPQEDITVVDLDEELSALLPLLVASYIWVEDEPEMASYYLGLYRERAADIERRTRNNVPVVVRDRYGWV